MALALIDKVTQNAQAFENRVREVSTTLVINPDWLMVAMYRDSLLNHLASNGTAFGLIQFTATTRALLGVTREQLANMTNVKQLDYVLKYYQKQGLTGKMKNVYDTYLGIFAPAYVGRIDSTILYRSPALSYTLNKGIDYDNSGTITIADVKKFVDKVKPISVFTPTANTAVETGISLATALVAMLIITYIFYPKQVKKWLFLQ